MLVWWAGVIRIEGIDAGDISFAVDGGSTVG